MSSPFAPPSPPAPSGPPRLTVLRPRSRRPFGRPAAPAGPAASRAHNPYTLPISSSMPQETVGRPLRSRGSYPDTFGSPKDSARPSTLSIVTDPYTSGCDVGPDPGRSRSITARRLVPPGPADGATRLNRTDGSRQAASLRIFNLLVNVLQRDRGPAFPRQPSQTDVYDFIRKPRIDDDLSPDDVTVRCLLSPAKAADPGAASRREARQARRINAPPQLDVPTTQPSRVCSTPRQNRALWDIAVNGRET